MKNLIRTPLLFAIICLLAACGGPKIDGRNSLTLEMSVMRITESLEDEEARRFSEDLQVIAASIMPKKKKSGDFEQARDHLLSFLDGKTVGDVHKEAENIRKRN